MLILIPWKPVVIAGACWQRCWVGYVGYSVVEGKNPFAMAQPHSYHLQTHSTADNGTAIKAGKICDEDSPSASFISTTCLRACSVLIHTKQRRTP